MRSKMLLATSIVAIVVVIAFIVHIALQPKQSDLEVVQTDSIIDQSNTKITIQNYSNYSDRLPKDVVDQFVLSVEKYLSDDELTKNYQTTIRKDSLKITTNGSITVTEFILDIPDVRRSYKFSLSNDVSTGENSLYTLCLAENEYIYPQFECKDDLKDKSV